MTEERTKPVHSYCSGAVPVTPWKSAKSSALSPKQKPVSLIHTEKRRFPAGREPSLLITRPGRSGEPVCLLFARPAAASMTGAYVWRRPTGRLLAYWPAGSVRLAALQLDKHCLDLIWRYLKRNLACRLCLADWTLHQIAFLPETMSQPLASVKRPRVPANSCSRRTICSLSSAFFTASIMT